MGAADGGSVAVSSRRVPFAIDLLAAAEASRSGGHLAPCLANFAGCPGRKGPVEMGRSLLGRQLRSGQKGGDAVGRTKRGKGPKWMVLGDGKGIPLGVRLERASPAEVTFTDATLKEVRVYRPKGRPRQRPKRVIGDRSAEMSQPGVGAFDNPAPFVASQFPSIFVSPLLVILPVRRDQLDAARLHLCRSGSES